MADEPAAIGLPALATDGLDATPVPALGQMDPPPSPSPRSRSISVLRPRGNGSADSVARNGDGVRGGHARTGAHELDVAQPSKGTMRYAPVRALNVGIPAVPEGVVVTGALAPSVAESLQIGPSERFEGTALPKVDPSLLVPPSPVRMAKRMSSIDRRVHSETLLPQKRHMSIASARRPSILTGGYESSTDDGSKETEDGQESDTVSRQPRLRGSGLLNHHSVPHLTEPPRGRRRAQSLLVAPHPYESWSPSSPQATSRHNSRFVRPIGTGSPLRTLAGGQTMTDSKSRSPTEAMLFSQPSIRMSHSTSGGGRSREASAGAAGYNREREDQRRMGNPLATSLGLGPSRPAVLSPDQIENLLGDDDFNSAKARMAKAARRPSLFIPVDPQQQQPQPISNPPTASSSTLPTNPSSIAIPPPPPSRPYLVTAPPPLTNGDWAGRDRSTSVSSSVGPGNAAGTPIRIVPPHYTRRRALSTTTLDSEGGHIPFTHHVPAVLIEDDDDDDDIETQELVPEITGETTDTHAELGRTVTATTNNSSEATPMSVPLLQQGDDRGNEHRARRRISELFGLRGRKRDLSPPPPDTLTHVQAAQPQAKKLADSGERMRNAEMRRAELARREEEQMEEQRYKALLLINAHPASQRRAQRAAMHLDRYYALIDQGLENPPKLNLLAVLRWKHKNEVQRQARDKWVREHVEPSSHLASPLLWPGGPTGGASPMSEGMHSLSPRLVGSSRPPAPHSITSATSRTEYRAGRDWQYMLDDIQGYNESGGRVEFFIPPNIRPDPIPRARSQSFSIRSEAQLSLPSAESPMGHENDPLSMSARVVSPSTPSLTQPLEFVDDATNSITDDLSRRPSLEPGSIGRPNRRGMTLHRTHHSTSGLPQHNSSGLPQNSTGGLSQPTRPIQTLRALGRGVKSNLANVMSAGPVLTDNEDEHRGAAVPSWTTNDSANSRHQHTNVHSLRDTRLFGLRRTHERNDNGEWVMTSDEDLHPFRRRFPRRIPRGFDKGSHGVVTAIDGVGSSISRTEQSGDPKQDLAREHGMPSKTTRAELELGAEEEKRIIESQVYVQHQRYVRTSDAFDARNLLEAQQQLMQVERAEADMDNAIAHFVSQLDVVSGVFHTAADVDVRFDGLEELSRSECGASDDEAADKLGPLAVESDVNLSDRNMWLSPRSPLRRHMRRGPSTAAAHGLPSFAYGLQAWPKRSMLDPILGVPVNPFHRVELSCQKAEATLRDMEEKRASTTRQIQDKVATINGFIAQKDAVLHWVKHANKNIDNAKAQRRAKSQQVGGGLLDTVLVLPGFDMVSDLLVRVFLTLLSYFLRLQRLWTWALGRGYLAWAIVIAIIAMLVGFYLVGSGELPAKPTGELSLISDST
ncbi:hypothetical protein CspeluHIS016_0201560 [Cutaneotrichosporon spelunceum]|uniref:Uncharacterized protein n=1 Tax=Cutaneotrichosporon spelunceum TaxID=1672016 RepID=A0AAD3Y9L3_9TREE|nr:hypothetical protein CspeluHIS016_0201560 [Cutaneotrichosporon spelunceum]